VFVCLCVCIVEQDLQSRLLQPGSISRYRTNSVSGSKRERLLPLTMGLKKKYHGVDRIKKIDPNWDQFLSDPHLGSIFKAAAFDHGLEKTNCAEKTRWIRAGWCADRFGAYGMVACALCRLSQISGQTARGRGGAIVVVECLYLFSKV